MLSALVVFVGGYLLGSIPVAYLIVRKSSAVDIRTSGSGNAGGFNAYVVTRSRMTGIITGILDGLKGVIAVYVSGLFFPNSFLYQGLALFGAIAGHNYSFWIGFKGGRGLATAAGGLFFLGFSYTIVWCSIWTITRLLKRDVLFSNILAILTTPLILLLVPWEWVRKLVAVKVDEWTFIFFTCILSTVLLLSHLDSVKDIWKGSKEEHSDILSPHS